MQVRMFLSLALLGLVLPAWSQANLLGNGDFSQPLSQAVPGADGVVDTQGSWIFYLNSGATATSALVGGEVVVTPQNIQSQPYGIQLMQSPVALTQGSDYELSFDARGAAPRTVVIKVGGTAARSWTAYSGEKRVKIGTTMAHYTVPFTMTVPSDPAARVEFWFTEAAPAVWLDNVALVQTKVGAPVVVPSKGTKTKADEDRLVKWQLDWSDEFDGKAIDRSNWTFETGGGGWGNNELEVYTDKPANASVQKLDGASVLALTARKEGGGYTSARLVSKGLVAMLYGKLEIRAKLPKGQGIWPALWLLGDDIDTVGWPGSGEIDLMENLGHDTKTIYSTIHGPVSGGAGVGKPFRLTEGDFSSAFHVFTMEWYPSHLEFLVDGKLFYVASKAQSDYERGPKDWVFDHPFFFILNVAVGGNWPGRPDATTKFPQTMAVDYVRLYRNVGDSFTGNELAQPD